jgi:hypothetical protein
VRIAARRLAVDAAADGRRLAFATLRGRSPSGVDMAELRTFETNAAAFEFACEHLDCALEGGSPVLAIVLAVQGRMCTVKIANREDKSIPTGTLNELLARTDLKYVCFSAMLDNKVPQVAPGDLVLFATMPELAAVGKATVAGTIVARVLPEYSSKSGWQPRDVEPRPKTAASADESALT